jgi:hypothetical protein
MTEATTLSIDIDGEEHLITITPGTKRIPGGDLYLTGVYRLSEGSRSMGDIVFDDDMNEWEYTGVGGLTHEEAEEIARFIQGYKESA